MHYQTYQMTIMPCTMVFWIKIHHLLTTVLFHIRKPITAINHVIQSKLLTFNPLWVMHMNASVAQLIDNYFLLTAPNIFSSIAPKKNNWRSDGDFIFQKPWYVPNYSLNFDIIKVEILHFQNVATKKLLTIALDRNYWIGGTYFWYFKRKLFMSNSCFSLKP